jgi:hypothetical protein
MHMGLFRLPIAKTKTLYDEMRREGLLPVYLLVFDACVDAIRIANSKCPHYALYTQLRTSANSQKIK